MMAISKLSLIISLLNMEEVMVFGAGHLIRLIMVLTYSNLHG